MPTFSGLYNRHDLAYGTSDYLLEVLFTLQLHVM